MLNVPSQSFPGPSSQQRVASGGRSKVPLKPGRSLMDWVRLTKSNKDLTGLKGRLIEVTAEELAKHNTKEDCWTCIRGLVYNVSPYMEYHPGGEEELMKAAGVDGTDLFDQVHRWVNYESMLKECLVGRMVVKLTVTSKEIPPKRTEAKIPFNGVAVSDKLLEAVVRGFPPRYDWFQTGSAVTIAIYTKQKDLESEMVTVDIEGHILRAEIIVRDCSYLLHLLLNHAVEEEVNVNVTGNVGKIEIDIKKQEVISWEKLGQPLDGHDSFIKHKDRELFYRKCKLVSKANVNYNTKLFRLLPSNGTFLQVPVGQHVYLKQTIADLEMVKPYTPVSSALRWNSQESLSTDSREIFLMIKIYPNGEFTPPLDNLQIGDELYVSGPQGSFKKSRVQNIEELYLLAAGTGLTPMIKLLNHVLTDVPSLKKVTLMFFNKKENDILWRSQLEELVLHDARFEVHFVLSEAADEWIGLEGTISLPLLSKIVRCEEKSNSLICICGPSMFTSQGIGFLEDLGFGKQVYGFTE